MDLGHKKIKSLNLLTDEELVVHREKGREDYFSELVRRYHRPVYVYLLGKVGDPDLVEDLTQETFIEAYRSLDNCRHPDRFRFWLFGIAKNRCGKWFRKKPHLSISEREPAMIEEEQAFENQDEVVRALDIELGHLSDDVQAVLRMKHREGKTCEEIARLLDRPTGTIKSILSRTYKNLRKRLKPYIMEP